jgi:hypothetical protein
MNERPLLEWVAETGRGVAMAATPLLVLFLVFQVALLRLPRKEVVRVLAGTSMAAAGLFVFLVGVEMAFLPFGTLAGRAMGALGSPWISLLAGTTLGFVTAWGEPSVRILAHEIEAASGGFIRSSLVVLAVCLGVAASVGIGLMRIVLDVPVAYFLVPGYAIVLLVMWASDKTFVAIAADAGGVATGPLANSFLLALAIGAASAREGSDAVSHGLGLVALISLAPILSILALGLVIRFKMRHSQPTS